MRRRSILSTLLLLSLGHTGAGQTGEGPRVFALRAKTLERIRAELATTKKESPAIAGLRGEAERALRVRAASVMDKRAIPPSGDKHDYMSLAPYWWPDPKSPDGLPYIRRDGERNPEINAIPDHANFGKLMSVSRQLALAYYLFADERYAAKATELLRTWFLDPHTRMNPNLQYAQAVKGHNQGRGTGLIETRAIGNVVDAVGLLAGSRAWTEADQRAMQEWCAKFLDWMLSSANGKDEAAATNNHGTFYDVQIASLALFAGRTELAREVITSAREKRVARQIEPDGSQPRELGRTRSFSYSVFNLTAMFELARLGDSAGVDLWSFRSQDGRSLRAALDYLLPFATGESKWTHPQIVAIQMGDLVPLLLEGSVRFKEPKYRAAALKLDGQAAESWWALLLNAEQSNILP